MPDGRLHLDAIAAHRPPHLHALLTPSTPFSGTPRAQVRFVSSALVAATSYFTSAFLQRNSIAASSSLRVRLLCLAGGLSLVPLPYTVLVLLPVNKNLMARAQQSRTDDAQVESKEASDEIDDNLRKWVQLNTVRYSIAGSAYLAALYALLL